MSVSPALAATPLWHRSFRSACHTPSQILPVRPPPTRHPRFRPGSIRLTLYTGFWTNDSLISGIRHPTYPDIGKPPFIFKTPDQGGYIIFSAAIPTARWVVHQHIARSLHPRQGLLQQRSSRRLNRGLASCHQRLTAYELLMRAWGGLCTRVNVGCR